jgi:hypothetical protein
MNKRYLLATAFLALVALACGFSAGGASDDNGNGGDNILLQDDFSDTGSGWDRSSTEEAVTDYTDGRYRILVNAESYSAWANPNQGSYSDTRVEVDATKAGGDDDNEYGLICRHQDINNFYVGTISSDGYYGFLIRQGGGSLELVGMDAMQPTDAIVQSEATNHIRLDCVGTTLTLYVNGTMVGSVSDSSISSGDVGLYAGTFEFAGTDILFDNFVVYQP